MPNRSEVYDISIGFYNKQHRKEGRMLESFESAMGLEYSEQIYEGQKFVMTGGKTPLVW